MSRRDVNYQNEAYYHLYNRGVNRDRIFFDDDNYLFFIENLKRYMLPALDIIAYCLMPTHYHILVFVIGVDNNDGSKQLDCPIAKSMQRLSISYTKAINNRYDRVGALFQGAYKAKPIDGIEYSRKIIPYIHQNPVNAGIVKNAIDWVYSSARVYEGIEESDFVTPLI